MDQMKTVGGFSSLFPIFIVFVLFYFLLIKPQQKKAKEHKNMIDNLSVGDEVVLSSGIIGEVDDVPFGKNYLFVRLNNDNVVRVFKDAIIDLYKETNTLTDSKREERSKYHNNKHAKKRA